MERQTYTYDEAFEASLQYFKGDELAARVWVNKYAVKDSFGNIFEKSPEDMHWRIANEVARIDPLPGAREFLDRLRTKAQVVILSDTFEQFGLPLMEKLNWPTLLCNTLEVGEDGMISGFRMRCSHSKLTTVRAFQSMGYDTIASGDSYNDLEMIRASKAGFLFRTTEQIRADYPQYPAFEEYGDLLAAIEQAL